MSWGETSYLIFEWFGQELKKVLAITFFLLLSSGAKNSLILFMGLVAFSIISQNPQN